MPDVMRDQNEVVEKRRGRDLLVEWILGWGMRNRPHI